MRVELCVELCVELRNFDAMRVEICVGIFRRLFVFLFRVRDFPIFKVCMNIAQAVFSIKFQ